MSHAEEAFVGALLNRPEMIGEAEDTVMPEDMGSNPSRWVYMTMLGLWRRGIIPTMTAVADEMELAGELVPIGGAAVLISLMAQAPSLRLDRYAPSILDDALRRRLALVAGDITHLAKDRDLSGAEAYDRAKDELASIDMPGTATNEVVDAPTFCAGEDSFDWLVPNLLERGERVIVVAPEAAGKSFLLRQLAVCGAYGIHPFTDRATEPFRVLLLDLENPEGLIRRKLRPMWQKAHHRCPQVDSSALGILVRSGGIDVTNRADARWLAAQLAAAKPDLVVAGPLYKMFSADDKWESGARAVTTILDDLRTRLGFALVLETHAPQGFGGRRDLRPIGSSLWLRWPETGISFTPVEHHEGVVKVTKWKSRDERYWPTFMRRGGEWPWTPCGDPEKGAESSRAGHHATNGRHGGTPAPQGPNYDQEAF